MQECNMKCTFYGCKRTYSDLEALNRHIQDHKIPAESLPGKIFLCSTIGCDGSFSNMQQLMEHMREHHKPNCFFLCESCKAKLRSYRTLLKHLQTCAKVAKSKAAKAGALAEPGMTPDTDPIAVSFAPVTVEQPSTNAASVKPEEMESDVTLSTPQLQPSRETQENSTLLGSFSSTGLPREPVTVLEPAVQSTANLSHLSRAEASCSPLPPNLSPAHTQPPLPDPALQQQQQKAPKASFPNLPLPPQHTPPGSNAVWRKNQAEPPGPLLHRWNSPPSSQSLNRDECQSFNCRILWEHTRGRYSCLQCGHSTPDRKEMTAHIEGQHKSPGGRLNNDSDVGVTSPSVITKTSTDSEHSVYTQL
ncbi:zinc finger protein 414 [Chanos chanos]|uniref:Zinc finger protein 414 n=1 Tax=Chanos chanos TaxID=29144 RepID=A0A6J2VIB7_CHACN|nr:zinc finger protein 414 [Chanos chanos]